MTHDEQVELIRGLTDWKTRAQLAHTAARGFADFDDAVARIVDDEDGAFGEVADLARSLVDTAHASIAHDERAPSPGAELLISQLGGAEHAVATLLRVIRILAEVAP